jgi:hypothetical protein
MIAATEGAKLTRLFEKYGIGVDSQDLGDSAGGTETAGASDHVA